MIKTVISNYCVCQYDTNKPNVVTVVGPSRKEGHSINVIIPQRVDGHYITHIAPYAFMGVKNLVSSIHLPKSIKSIGKWAFAFSNVTDIILAANSNCDIDKYAFYGSTLYSTENFDTNTGNVSGKAFINSHIESLPD